MKDEKSRLSSVKQQTPFVLTWGRAIHRINHHNDGLGKPNARGTQRQFSENICSEDDLRSRIFGTFVVKFLACLPLLGFSNIYKMV